MQIRAQKLNRSLSFMKSISKYVCVCVCVCVCVYTLCVTDRLLLSESFLFNFFFFFFFVDFLVFLSAIFDIDLKLQYTIIVNNKRDLEG